MCRNDLVQQYQRLDASAGQTTEMDAVPNDVITYVEDGRNPSIYTREFVELVGKSNAIHHGRRRAFERFRDILAEQMVVSFPELEKEVAVIKAGTS